MKFAPSKKPKDTVEIECPFCKARHHDPGEFCLVCNNTGFAEPEAIQKQHKRKVFTNYTQAVNWSYEHENYKTTKTHASDAADALKYSYTIFEK